MMIRDRVIVGAIAIGTLAIAVASSSSAAAAYKFEDIAGKWCTAGGSEQFDRKNLIAVVTSTGQRTIYPIVTYEYLNGIIRVTWKRKGANVHTDFAEFSRDGRQMVQLKSEDGPRREFHRC